MNRKAIWQVIITIFLCLPVAAQSHSKSLSYSLNGDWQFSIDNFPSHQALLTDDYATWDSLVVPGNWDTTDRYKQYVGKAYYQKSFVLPKAWKNKHIRLKFNAVYQTAHVWLNGEYLGKHVGGYTPFEFNVSEHIRGKGKNSLVVMADNSFKRGAWWGWGGISRDVTLFADPSIRIVSQHISAIPDFNQKTVHFSVNYKLENLTDTSQQLELSSQIMDVKHSTYEVKTQVAVPANAKINKKIVFQRPLTEYQLWQPGQAKLYQLQSSLSHKNKLISDVVDNFGIRLLEVRGEQFYLNDQAIKTIGINRVHDHPQYGNAEPAHLVKQDLDDILALGVNFSRLMHAPYAKSVLEYADKMGLMLVAEIPVWGDDDPNSFPDNPLTKQWLKEMIEGDFNHPSIVGWSVGNELRDPRPPWGKKLLTPKQLGYVNSMLDYVAELDPTRLKTYVSITAYSELASAQNEPFEKVDFISINSYGNAVSKVETTHRKFPGKPIFLSEIGIGQIGGSKDSTLAPALINDLTTLKDYDYLSGFSLWSYNDYRSNYKGTPKSGFREWGIVDHLRNKKQAYFQLKQVIQDWQKDN